VAATLIATLGCGEAVASAHDLEPIEVIEVTPLYSVGLPREKIATNVQSATAEQLQQQQSLDLSDYLNRSFANVTINAAQNNPLQPDVQYRGFTASPLLGLPQGIAVYTSGVRVNESFGDTVNWDLLPESIIDRIDLMGGSNPLYGLNTLGGALSIQTKNGFTHPGLAAEASTGSFGRTVADLEVGGSAAEFGYYANAHQIAEDGWRADSPTRATSLFGSLGWRTEVSTVDLDYLYADSNLIGNGASPAQLLAADREAVFTTPDRTKNHLHIVIANASHWLTEMALIAGNAFYRHSQADSFNGDATPFTSCDDGSGNAGLIDERGFVDANDDDECEAGEFDPTALLVDQTGTPIGAQFDAVNNEGHRDQRSFGTTVQTTLTNDLFKRSNQLIVGAAFDQADIGYASRVEVAMLQPDRSTDRSGIYAIDAASAIDADTRNASLYFTDTLSITSLLTLTVSGRYNASAIDLSNAGPPIDADEDGHDDLDGHHDFTRLNPAVGATYQFATRLSGYVGYGEASRTPTPVELACASETAPCTLPNTFLADPPLKQVVAKTYELGLRGNLSDAIKWNTSLFDTRNSDDIIFQATGGISGNQGFFANVGDTRRSGVELSAAGTWGQLAWYANYSFLRAVFDDPFTSSSPAHPGARDVNGDGKAREIRVHSGDRIPGIPQSNAKLGIDYRFDDAISLGADVTFNSGQYLRGDEANLLDQTGAFAVVNVRAAYRFSEHVTAFATV
jgi:outer membrane receptor protein involved in Fe transport